MAVLRMRGNDEGKLKNQNHNQIHKVSFPKVEQIGKRKSLFHSTTADLDMLVWLKGLALDPCKPKTSNGSVQRLLNYTLKWRKILCLSNPECPKRKRKLEQFLGAKFSAASGLASENFNCQNAKKLGCEQMHYVSCSPNLSVITDYSDQQTVPNSCSSGSVLTFDNSFQQQRRHTDPNISDNAIYRRPFNEDVSLIEMDESVNGSYSSSLENITVRDPHFVDSDDLVSSPHSLSSKEKLQQEDKLLITESEGENIPRPVIPVGPRFQAELPECSGSVNKGNLYGCDDAEILKWLGTRIWPIEIASTRSSMKVIGRGRPESCPCVSPGSVECIKHHTLSARFVLQSELGPVFLSWKFDEMGEVASKTWTLREQDMFDSLMNDNTSSDGTDFWGRALKCFPSKGKKSILSYYYNVFTPRRISQQTRSSLDEVDSDDEMGLLT